MRDNFVKHIRSLRVIKYFHDHDFREKKVWSTKKPAFLQWCLFLRWRTCFGYCTVMFRLETNERILETT